MPISTSQRPSPCRTSRRTPARSASPARGCWSTNALPRHSPSACARPTTTSGPACPKTRTHRWAPCPAARNPNAPTPTSPQANPEVLQALSGRAELRNGYFVAPALFPQGRSGMQVAQDEIFGPVQVVIPFRDEADAVRIANDSRHGLAGVVCTRDGARAMRMCRALQIGNIAINDPIKVSVDAPFGGFKESGLGKERGIDAILENTQVKNVRFSMR